MAGLKSLSGYQKSALFLSVIGDEAASEVLKLLDKRELGKITQEMTKISVIKEEEKEEILEEASRNISTGDIHMRGEDYVKQVLSKGYGMDNADKILKQASEESPIESLRYLDPKTIAGFLSTEHPQTIALILSLLDAGQASEVLGLMPMELRKDVAYRVASMESIPESAVAEIEIVLKELEQSKGIFTKGQSVSGKKIIAEILNQADKNTEKAVMEKIEEEDGELASSIRQLMFVFEDLNKIDDRGIQMIMKEISTEDLTIAMKTASDMLKEKIFSNMSQRAADILKEEMEGKGPVRVTEVEKAQLNIIGVAKRLDEEGKIAIAKSGEEVLVV